MLHNFISKTTLLLHMQLEALQNKPDEFGEAPIVKLNLYIDYC